MWNFLNVFFCLVESEINDINCSLGELVPSFWWFVLNHQRFVSMSHNSLYWLLNIPIFPGKYHRNGGCSMAMFVYRSVPIGKSNCTSGQAYLVATFYETQTTNLNWWTPDFSTINSRDPNGFIKESLFLGVSLNGGTPKTSQNDHF